MADQCPSCGGKETARLHGYSRKSTGDTRIVFRCWSCGQQWDTAPPLPAGHNGVQRSREGEPQE